MEEQTSEERMLELVEERLNDVIEIMRKEGWFFKDTAEKIGVKLENVYKVLVECTTE